MRKIAELWRKIRFRTIWRELMRAYEMDHDMPFMPMSGEIKRMETLS